MPLKTVSIFCGLGGMDLGLLGGFHYLNNYYAHNGYEIVYSVDIEPSAVNIYNANFSHKAIIGDITTIPSEDIPSHDLLLGGFPCQSFSVSAQNPPRLGFRDVRGKLFFEMCRLLKFHKPRFFIAENVKGILSANKKRAFPLIINEFEKAGYFVKYKLMNAADFGIPQKRERVFIVGFRDERDFLKFNFPAPTHINNHIPLLHVLEDQDCVEEKYFFSDKAVEGLKKSKSYEKMNKGRAQCIHGPSNTVSAHLAKVSLNSTDPVLKIGERYRMYTPREVARIQSFPEEFKLTESKTKNYKALGNAVAPVMMWHLTQELNMLLS